jgi:hypothetical protein
MKLSLKILAIVATAATTYSMVSCSAPASFSYQNVSISLTAQCTDCPAGITFNPAYPMPTVSTTGQGGSNGAGGGASGVIPVGAVMTMPSTSEGGTVEFLASVQNAPAANVTWAIYPQPNLTGIDTLPTGTSTPVGESGSSVGTFATPGGSSTTATGPNVYYSIPGVPVYSGQALAQAQAMGIPQGDFLLVASVPSDPENPSAVATFSLLVQDYGGSTAQGPPSAYLTPHTPTTPSGLVNPVVTVAHNPSLPTIATNGQYQFYGGVVGAAPCLTTATCLINGVQYPLYTTDNTAVWEVGPTPFSLSTAFVCQTPGLACPYGTISQTGLYTAPAAIPPTPSGGTANEVVVVLVSQLVGTVDSYAYVGLY